MLTPTSLVSSNAFCLLSSDQLLASPQELKELISSYQTLRESGRGPAICNTIIETARQCNLDKDIKLPEGDAKELDLAQRDGVVGSAYSRSAFLLLCRVGGLLPGGHFCCYAMW